MILAVSADSLADLELFNDEHNIGFALISDPDEKVRRLYEPGRITYVIDKQGVIRSRQEGVPDNEKLLDTLRSLQ